MTFLESFSSATTAFFDIIGSLWWIFLLAALTGWLKNWKPKGKKNKKRSHDKADFDRYSLRSSILTPAELNFYDRLKVVVGPKFVIIIKIRLADIFDTSDGRGYYASLEKIAQKHVDFLLCHPTTFKPVLGIELDDRSHNRKSRQKRDKFVDELFAKAGLPLLHIAVKKDYQPEEIAQKIIAAVKQSQ